MFTCGMPRNDHEAFFSPETDPLRKWDLLEPYWPRIHNTGYAQAVDIAVRQLYGVERLSRGTVGRVQDGYRKGIRPGFYEKVLRDVARIESCQVNSLEAPFSESPQSTLLMQDISILGLHMGPDVEAYAKRAGIDVRDLADWHRVIDWWFETYGPYAVAVKTQAAYSRNIDFADVPAEEVEGVFKKVMEEDPVDPAEEKRLQDHLFWYSARKATEQGLPVKVHTGYYGDNRVRARDPPGTRARLSAARRCISRDMAAAVSPGRAFATGSSAVRTRVSTPRSAPTTRTSTAAASLRPLGSGCRLRERMVAAREKASARSTTCTFGSAVAASCSAVSR
jgi:hypothetical protein